VGVFCDECGSAFTKPTSKYCGNCGAEKLLSVEHDVADLATNLSMSLSAKNLSADVITSILEAHGSCFEGDLCDVCEYLDDSDEDFAILHDLASQPNLTPELQGVVLAMSFLWDGRSEAVCMELAGNPHISNEVKTHLLADFSWTNGEDMDETVQDFVDIIRRNKRFTSDEVEAVVLYALNEGLDVS
jgi:hypothetical protein